jgi:hypothetical protein
MAYLQSDGHGQEGDQQHVVGVASPHIQHELELTGVGCEQRDVQQTLRNRLLGRVLIVAEIL